MTIRRLVSVLLAVAMGAAACSAMADDHLPPPALARVGKWNLNYDDNSCSLNGEFGTGDKQLLLRAIWFDAVDSFQLELMGKALAAEQPSTEISIDFGPLANPVHEKSMNGTSGKLALAVLLSVRLDDAQPSKDPKDLPAISPEQEVAVQWLDLRISGHGSVRLALGSMGPVMKAVHQCTRDLVQHWGYDPDVQATLLREAVPITPPQTWLRSTDFPTVALMWGMNGIVHLRLDVSETGEVTDCHLLGAIKPADFDKPSCDLLRKRAHFVPALDKEGKPVRSFDVTAIRWQASD